MRWPLVFTSPALKRWANEFRRYAADTGTLYAGTLYADTLYATNLYATNFRLRPLETRTQRLMLSPLCNTRTFAVISAMSLS
jgi:hypothetical protein